MKIKFNVKAFALFFFALILLFPFLGSAQSNPPLDSLINVALTPPKIAGLPLSVALMDVKVYLTAVFTIFSVYGAQWIPVLKTWLAKVNGYTRSVIAGGAILWVLIAVGKITDWQALLAFVFANIVYGVAQNFITIPKTPTQLIAKARKVKLEVQEKE